MTLGMAGLWLILALSLRRHYLDVFRQALASEVTQTRIDFPSLDGASFQRLLETLNDPDDGRVLAALDLLAEQGKSAAIPAMILYHPSPAVVLRALDIFVRSGRDDFIANAERLLSHPNAEVRAATLRSLTMLRPAQKRLRFALKDPAPVVKATAVVGLMAGGWMDGLQGRREVARLLQEDARAARIGLACAIRSQPNPRFEAILLEMAGSTDTEVCREVIRAMGAMGSLAFLPALLDLLSFRALREDVRSALQALGESALDPLEGALVDTSLPHSVRRHIPQTLAGLDPQRAADFLLRHLVREKDGMVRFKTLRALGRLRGNHSDMALEVATLDRATQETLAEALRLMQWRRALESGARRRPECLTSAHQALTGLLRHKQIHALERVFRLLDLRYQGEDLRKVHRGLQSANLRTRASGRELLENRLDTDFRVPLLQIIDDLEESGSRKSTALKPEPEYGEVLHWLLCNRSRMLGALAARQVGELGIVALRPELEARLKVASAEQTEVIQNALQMLPVADQRDGRGK